MRTFELSKTKPKLQNNRVIALYTRQFYTITLCVFTCLFLSNVDAYSQDIPYNKELNIPAEKKKDSLPPTNIDTKRISFDTISKTTIVVDSTKTDTLKPEVLTDIVEYYGEDYVYMSRDENKVYMYNEAFVIYGDMRLDAGLIILDYNKNEVYAKGIDSAGTYSQRPVFVQGGNKVEPDSIRFNFDTQKALVYNSRTEQNGFNVISEVTKKENDSVYFLSNVKFTTSENIDDPEYYFYTRRAKFIPKKKVVTGLTNMYIADVPTPIGLPFAYFPMTEDRTSGFIIPTIGENSRRGFFFQNGGYYFAINDFLDLTLQGDYYTNGSYGLRGESSYAVRYKFNGNVSVRFENLIDGERGFDGFGETKVYNIRWRHTQDAKASPSSRFSASVNLGSSRFFTESINQVNNASSLVNTLSSSVSYAKTFETEPQVNVTVAATHTQNTNTQVINLSLPNVTANVSRVFPFAPKSGAKKGIIENINFQYDVTAQNSFVTTDSLFFRSEMFQDARIGARHTIPISTNFKILDYLSASASTNYQETWVGRTFTESFDPTLNEGQGGVAIDTVRGFDSYRTYNFSMSLGTTIYGQFPLGEDKKIQAIRHVMRPSISYSINPAFDQFYDDYVIPSTDPEVIDEVVSFSRFQRTLFGAPNENYSSTIGLSLSNSIEAKVRQRDTTATEPKKITLLNNLNFSTGYNLAADSLRLSPIRFTGSIPIVKRLDFNFNGNLDAYALNNSNQRINTLNLNNGGSLFRLTDANISINYSFSDKDFLKGAETEDDSDFDSETFRNGGRPDDLFGTTIDNTRGNAPPDPGQREVGNTEWYNYSLPWNVRLAYTMTYNNRARQNEIQSQTVSFSSNVELSPRWTVGMQSGYDFKGRGVAQTSFNFERDLESWRLNFSWTPIGARTTSWYFFIGIRSSVLSDIKYDKRREPDRRL